MIDDTDVHYLGVKIDAAVMFVLLGIKPHGFLLKVNVNVL